MTHAESFILAVRQPCVKPHVKGFGRARGTLTLAASFAVCLVAVHRPTDFALQVD